MPRHLSLPAFVLIIFSQAASDLRAAEVCASGDPIKSTSMKFTSLEGTGTLIGFDSYSKSPTSTKIYRRKTTTGTMSFGRWTTLDCSSPNNPTSYSDGLVGDNPPGWPFGPFDWSASLDPVSTANDGRVLYRAKTKGQPPSSLGAQDEVDIRIAVGGLIFRDGDEGYLDTVNGRPPFTVVAFSPKVSVWGSLTSQVKEILSPATHQYRDVWNATEGYDKDDLSDTKINITPNQSVRYHKVSTEFPLVGGGDVEGAPSLNSYAGMTAASKTATKTTIVGTDSCAPVAGGSGKVKGTYTETLSDEDVEEDAQARATSQEAIDQEITYEGTRNVAYRTNRFFGGEGVSRSFAFSQVKYTALFSRCCAGSYLLFVVYSEYSSETNLRSGPIRKLLKKQSFETGENFVTGEVIVGQEPFLQNDTEYTIIRLEAEHLCPEAEPASSGSSLGSIRFWMNLGRAAGSTSAGQLRLDAEGLSPDVYSAAALSVTHATSEGVEVVRDSVGLLRQVRAPQTVADIVVLSPVAYEVRFYAPDQLGTQDTNSKIYAFNGSAFASYKLENPDAPLGQSARLRVTENRGAISKVTEFAYDLDLMTWTLSQGSGLRHESELTTLVNEGRYQDRAKTKTVRDGSGKIISKVTRTYRAFEHGEELISEVIDPDGAVLVTRYDYYDESDGPSIDEPDVDPNSARLRQRTMPSGDWERYSYDNAGRVSKTIRPFLDCPPNTTNDSLCRTTQSLHSSIPDADGDGETEVCVTTIETTLGRETARRYRVEWSKQVSLTGDSYNRKSDIACVAAGAPWDDAANLVTESLSYVTGGPFSGRERRILNADGTAHFHRLSLAPTGLLTTTSTSGQPNAAMDDIVDGRRTVSLTSATGQTTSETVTDIASGLTLSSWTATVFDAVGRPTRIEYSDGTLVTRSYACCGLASERDRTGLITTYSYDPLGRQVGVTRAGITTRTAYDAEGRALSTTRVGSDGSEIAQSFTTYDSAGRITSTRDALLRTTTYAESLEASTGRVTRTTTNPGGGTVIEISARDGSRLSVGGTAAAPHAFDYGVDATGTYTKDTAIGVDANNQPTATEWVKSYTDFAGRSFKTVFADGASTQSFSNAVGQLVRQVDPDGVTTLFAYNARGEQEVVAVDVNANGLIDFGGTDRIAKTTSAIATKLDGATYIVQRTTTQVWEADHQNTPVTISVSEQSTDGLRSWQTSRGLTSKSVTTLDGSGGRTVITTAPDGVQSVQVSTNGRLVSSTIRTAANIPLAATTNTYDAHGRTVSTTDARNGTTTLTYLADDQLNTVTTADPDATRSGPGYDAQTTTYAYDPTGRVQTVTQPDGTAVNTTYYSTGAVKRTWGSRTYPVEYSYDPQGRVKTLTTWQNFAGDTGKAVTTWNYDAARGFLLNKRHADNTGPSYTYKPSGRLLTRTWARTPTVTATYTYHSAGDLLTTAYSDPTPSVAITYDRSGRPISIVDGAGSRTLAYHLSGQLQSEAYTAGLLNGHVVSRTYDALLRPSGIAALNPQASPLNTIAHSYDAASRLDTVTSGANTASYVYLANSPLVESVTYKNAGTTRLTATKSYDKLNRLSAINTQLSTGPALSHTYTYNAANQRTRTTREDNAYWSYAYDSLGQVTSAGKFLADATPALGLAHAYAYDDIGNRKTATTNGQTATYAPNLLNQYVQRTVPATVDVSGAAAASATVTIAVNNTPPQPTTRQGETFFKQLTVDNSVAAQNPTLTITGVKNLAGPNGEDAVTQVTKTAFLARTPEVFTHDADGNLTDDARWRYTWDAENRLIALETSTLAGAAGVTRQKLEFSYDAQGRRITKKVSLWNPTTLSYQVSTQTVFLYDGWNLLAELNFNSTTSTLTMTRSYVWGQDLSGSFQGAGGVGGLISVTDAVAGITHFATADGNGNVAALAKATDGTLTANYDYNAFGETVATEGAFAAGNPFRFSTKYTDEESGHLSYGRRYYDPSNGRWLSRDPIGEAEGGPNLYGMVGNNPTNDFDAIGEKAYLMYRKLNISLLNKTFPISGHVYLLFDEEGMGDAWKSAKTASKYSFGRPITMSFHPYAVWASQNPAAAAEDKKIGRHKKNRLSVFVTEGSSVVVNDPEDYKPGTSRKLITANECEQIKLFEIALMSAVLNNFGIPDPAKYSFASSNCAHWADTIVRRAGLRSPGLGAWNLGVGNYYSPVGAIGYGATLIGKTVFGAIDFLSKN